MVKRHPQTKKVRPVRDYRIKVKPSGSGDVTVSLKSSGTVLHDLGIVEVDEVLSATIPNADAPPTLSIVAERPDMMTSGETPMCVKDDSMDNSAGEGVCEGTGAGLTKMVVTPMLSSEAVSHYRFRIATVDSGEDVGTATPCEGRHRECKAKEDPDDYIPADHYQFLRMVNDPDDGLVFEGPYETYVYLLKDDVKEVEGESPYETVKVELSEAWTTDDNGERVCRIGFTDDMTGMAEGVMAEGMILNDDE